MVLYPIADQKNDTSPPVPIWNAVEESQKQVTPEYWLVTQPAHANLAGELASALREDFFAPIDETVSRCIALHDAGWSMADAEQIHSLRSNPKLQPRSFVDASFEEARQAWTRSIETAEKFEPVGGYLVSSHFAQLSQRVDPQSKAKFEAFRKQETVRRQCLRSMVQQDEKTLELLIDALQFCDVLSLYLCCGSTRSVEIGRQRKTLVTRKGEEYKLQPSPFKGACQFSFSALRHPAPTGSKRHSGATFYINL